MKLGNNMGINNHDPVQFEINNAIRLRCIAKGITVSLKREKAEARFINLRFQRLEQVIGETEKEDIQKIKRLIKK